MRVSGQTGVLTLYTFQMLLIQEICCEFSVKMVIIVPRQES